MYRAAVGCVRAGVAFRLYLGEGLVCCAVQLELEDVDVLRGLYGAVYATLALRPLHACEVNADHSQNQIERVLEISFPLPLVLPAANCIRYVRQERCEQVADTVRLSVLECVQKILYPTADIVAPVFEII